MKHLFFFFIASTFCWHFKTNAQEITRKVIRKQRPVFLTVAIGSGKNTFRDFATSPLTYRSFPGSLIGNKTKTDSTRSSLFEIKYTGGLYVSKLEKLKLGKAQAHITQVHYQQLYQIPKWCNKKWNIKTGGAINYLQTFRINTSLQNNAVGAEGFLNLMGAIQANKDISRTKAIDKKILGFIKYKREPRKRELSYLFEAGLMNNTIRNGYSYIGQASVVNKSPLLDNYNFNFFSGLRFRTKIDYKVFLENGNAISLAYHWDAMRTSNKIDPFELAMHTLSIGLMFRTK